MKNKHYENLIDIGVNYYEQNFYKDLIAKTRKSIDKLEEMIYENGRLLKSSDRIREIDIQKDGQLSFLRYSPINKNEDTGNIDPLNIDMKSFPWEIDSDNSFTDYNQAVKSEIENLKETKEKYQEIENKLNKRVHSLKDNSSKYWDDFWIDLFDYSNDGDVDIKQIEVKEATDNILKDSEKAESTDTSDTDRGYLPNLKYQPELFSEYYDLINTERYPQVDAANKVLKNEFGDDFESNKKASIESFIKRARESLKPKKKNK